MSTSSFRIVHRKIWIVFLLQSVFVFQCIAQDLNPGPDKIYRPDELTWIYLTMAAADKAFLQDPANALSEVYFPAAFRMKNSQMDTTLAKNVGVKLRGNTSRYAQKKSFKIDFRQFGGKKFFEFKKFNLKANVNDPSLIREALTLDQYREMNVPAARTHHVRLYINNEFMGVYLNVEQIDNVFLNMRFGHETGFLYKCSWGANLTDNGQVFDAVMFESEINETMDTRSELNHLVQILNHTSDANFVAELEAAFNVDRYLRQLAVEALMGHWDGYSYNQNNYYLYYNGQTHKFEFFPYDVDNTWGIDWLGQDWGRHDLNAWGIPGPSRPLTNRILSVPAYQELYKTYLRQVLETTFNKGYVYPHLTTYKQMLELAVTQDSYFIRAFGFTYQDFVNSFTTQKNNHVKYGLKEYLDERTKYAYEQMPELVTATEKPGKVSYVYPNPTPGPNIYYYTSTSSPLPPKVFSSTGIPMDITVRPCGDDQYEILLPENAAKGLYLLKTQEKVFKWVYR